MRNGNIGAVGGLEGVERRVAPPLARAAGGVAPSARGGCGAGGRTGDRDGQRGCEGGLCAGVSRPGGDAG